MSRLSTKTFKNVALATASALLMAACASTTPFQPASKPGGFDGYSQTMIENDRARITFGGNSLTERDTVENYLLFRTAQVAKEKGFDHFTLERRDTEQNTRLRSSGLNRGYGGGFYDPYFGYSFYRPSFGWSGFHPYSRFGYGRSGFRRGFGRYGGFGGFGHDPFFNDYDVREVTKYRATAEAKFGRGFAPDSPDTFDADEVIANLGPTIRLPEQDG